ncbi:MAG: hypothetical protein WA208_20170 [Thermoanaerobaculia bacterium]
MPEKRPAPPIDDAPDLVAAVTIRNEVAALNGPMMRRSALNEADHETIASIREAAETFATEARGGQVVRVGSEKAIEPKRLAAMITDYVTLLTATKTEHVGDLTLESDTPAIESTAVRRHVEKLGGSILALLDTFLAQRRRREAQRTEQSAAIAQQIERFRTDDPIAGPLMDVYGRLIVSIASKSPTYARDHIIAARLREALAVLLPRESRVPIIAKLDEDAMRIAPPIAKRGPAPKFTQDGAQMVSAPEYPEITGRVRLGGLTR